MKTLKTLHRDIGNLFIQLCEKDDLVYGIRALNCAGDYANKAHQVYPLSPALNCAGDYANDNGHIRRSYEVYQYECYQHEWASLVLSRLQIYLKEKSS